MKCMWGRCLYLAAIHVLASCADNSPKPRKPRVLRGLGNLGAHPDGFRAHSEHTKKHTHMVSDGLGNITEDPENLRETLLHFGWTMMMGDSVLASQFLTIAGELQAQTDEPALSHVAQCTDPALNNAWPATAALWSFTDKPIEYLILCGPSNCTFSRLGCMNFAPDLCGAVVCYLACTGTKDWDQMVATIQNTVSQPGHFAVSFHWAPSYVVKDQLKARMTAFVPGAFLWNNCHHWSGHATQDESLKLPIWQQYLEANAVAFDEFVTGGTVVAYQGCTYHRCLNSTSDPYSMCQQANWWYVKANAAARPLMAAHNIAFVDVQPLLTETMMTWTFLDNQHPCLPIPCMWSNYTQNAPRQICVSMLMHTLQTMNSSQLAVS